jgi:hypothetical protein
MSLAYAWQRHRHGPQFLIQSTILHMINGMLPFLQAQAAFVRAEREQSLLLGVGYLKRHNSRLRSLSGQRHAAAYTRTIIGGSCMYT